ncbi:MAG: HAMP domain-containing protein, partial [bacterium]|nr:HAMP domain-containing protein [bacterium]
KNPQLNPSLENLVAQEITAFEERFYRPVLNDHLRRSKDLELIAALDRLETHWLTLKENLNTNNNKRELLQQIDNFVFKIDNLVKMLESQTETKFRLLRLIQGISLLATIIIVIFGIVDINSNVVGPLRQLFLMASRVQAGDFSKRVKVKGDDELSLLANTFNDMAESLDVMYQDLEQKVNEKTLYLEQARDSIALLYTAAQHLSEDGSII